MGTYWQERHFVLSCGSLTKRFAPHCTSPIDRRIRDGAICLYIPVPIPIVQRLRDIGLIAHLTGVETGDVGGAVIGLTLTAAAYTTGLDPVA